MNYHLIQPFELRICQIFYFFHGGFGSELKSGYYWAQMKNRRAKKKVRPNKKMLWTSKNRQARK